MKINILGVEYKIEIHKVSDDELLKENHWCGYCAEESKKIVVADMTEKEVFGNLSEIERNAYRNRTLRHEIVHAFLNESGLSDDASATDGSWAKNEEMVDWFAIQSPKIFKAYKEADCL